MYLGLQVKSGFSCQIVIKLVFLPTDFRGKKWPNVKLRENPSSGSRVVPCGQTDMKLIIYGHKNDSSLLLLLLLLLPLLLLPPPPPPPQLYNSVWVLAFSIIPLHGFLSCAFCFQLFTPIVLKSSLTSSSHLNLGLPFGLVACGFHL